MGTHTQGRLYGDTGRDSVCQQGERPQGEAALPTASPWTAASGTSGNTFLLCQLLPRPPITCPSHPGSPPWWYLIAKRADTMMKS